MPDLFAIVAAADAAANPIVAISEQFGLKPQLIVAQMVNFALVAFVLYRFAFRPVMKTLDERQKRIAQGLQDAEDARKQLEDAQARHAAVLREAQVEAQAIVRESQKSARLLLEKQTQEAAAKVEEMLEKGRQASDLERRKMLDEVRGEVARLVVLTSSRVLARELSAEDRARFNTSAAREITNSQN